MGIIRRPSISPPPPFLSPYESGWSRRSRREQKYNWKKFSRENFPLLSNKTKTLFLGGRARAFFFSSAKLAGLEKWSRISKFVARRWRLSEIISSGGGGESRFYSKGYDGYSILAQFTGFYSRGERGKETRVFLAQGREFRNGRDAYTRILCVSSLKAMHANEWDGGGIGTIGSIRGKNSEGLASISRRN